MNTYSKVTAVDANFCAAGMTGSTSGLDCRKTSRTEDAEPRGGSSTLQQGDWGGVRRCGATLNRTCSSASRRFRGAADGGSSSGMPAVMRRAFSMRRPSSSSLAEGYWRIHDTGDEGLQQQMKSGSRTKKKGMIFKAWKKLFGF